MEGSQSAVVFPPSNFDFVQMNENHNINTSTFEIGEGYYLDFEKTQQSNTGRDISSYFLCLICQGLVVSPIECSQCETAFCSKCIQTYTSQRAPPHNKHLCPQCRGPWIPRSVHRVLRTQLNDLKLQCPKECQSEPLSYEQLVKHLEAECPKIKLFCPFKCGQTFLRPDFLAHLEQCPNAWSKCKTCNCKLRIKEQADHTCIEYFKMKLKEMESLLKSKDKVIEKLRKNEQEQAVEIRDLRAQVGSSKSHSGGLLEEAKEGESAAALQGCWQKKEKVCKFCQAVRPSAIGTCGAKAKCTMCNRIQVFLCKDCDKK